MIILSWNMRGLNSPQKQFALKQQFSNTRIDILLIQEVKMTMANLDSISGYIWPGAKYCYSEAEGASGGVATFWNPSVGKENFIHNSKYYLITEHKKDEGTWNVISMYAPNLRQGRCWLWEELSNFLSHSRKSFCMGNFNSPLYPSEQAGRAMDFTDSMKDLAEFINKNDLMDLEMRGVKFTWSTNRKGVDLI